MGTQHIQSHVHHEINLVDNLGNRMTLVASDCKYTGHSRETKGGIRYMVSAGYEFTGIDDLHLARMESIAPKKAATPKHSFINIFERNRHKSILARQVGYYMAHNGAAII